MVMPGIADYTGAEFEQRLGRFRRSYVTDWDARVRVVEEGRSVESELGRILRGWQACRPNTMRRTRDEHQHAPPFLEDLTAQASPHVLALSSFDVASPSCYTAEARRALNGLWNVFVELSYRGIARDGKAGIVGISKASLLLTMGRVGPAFDSLVRSRTGVGNVLDAEHWIEALSWVTRDIVRFTRANGCTLQEAAPSQFRHLASGRLYDMALGPGTEDEQS
jgi:hypothetical protein